MSATNRTSGLSCLLEPPVSTRNRVTMNTRKLSDDAVETSSASVFMDEQITLQRSIFPFEKLPSELRNMCYDYCLNTSIVPITSPCKKIVREREKPAAKFWSLLLLSKAIHKEASSWYYKSTTFLFGNHIYWGCSYHANIHGMQAFTRRVSKTNLALITTIRLKIHYYESNQTLYLGTQTQISGLQTMARVVAGNFPGLKDLSLGFWEAEETFWVENMQPVDEEVVQRELFRTMKKMLLTLLWNQGIEVISIAEELEPKWWRPGRESLQMIEAAREIVTEIPQRGRVLRMHDLSEIKPN